MVRRLRLAGIDDDISMPRFDVPAEAEGFWQILLSRPVKKECSTVDIMEVENLTFKHHLMTSSRSERCPHNG